MWVCVHCKRDVKERYPFNGRNQHEVSSTPRCQTSEITVSDIPSLYKGLEARGDAGRRAERGAQQRSCFASTSSSSSSSAGVDGGDDGGWAQARQWSRGRPTRGGLRDVRGAPQQPRRQCDATGGGVQRRAASASAVCGGAAQPRQRLRGTESGETSG